MYCSEFADPVVAKATLDFLNWNKKKILTSFPTLLPQVCSEIQIFPAEMKENLEPDGEKLVLNFATYCVVVMIQQL